MYKSVMYIHLYLVIYLKKKVKKKPDVKIHDL